MQSVSDPSQAAAKEAELHRLRGFVESAQKAGNRDVAIDALARIAVINQDDPSAHSALAMELAAAERYEEAINPFRWALSLEPNNAGCHFALGNALKYTGRFNKAIASYRRAVELEPETPSIVEGLGVALAEASRPEEAIEVFRQALALDDSAVTVHFNLGIAFVSLERFAEAKAEFEKCLTLEPLHADAAFNLGIIALSENEADQALTQSKVVQACNAIKLRRRGKKSWLRFHSKPCMVVWLSRCANAGNR